MKSLAEKFLTSTEQELVTTTVQEAEKRTSGEIVPMIVSSSDEYPLAAVYCAIAFSLPLSILLTHILGNQFWLGPQNMYLFLLLFLGLSVTFGGIASKSSRLKKYFLSGQQVEKQVQQAALAAFYREQLYKTENENGILLYISVMEQKVWILADRSINECIDQSTWDTLIDELTTGIKAGEHCDAICDTIERMGEILFDYFPYKKDDKDELHNLIIR